MSRTCAHFLRATGLIAFLFLAACGDDDDAAASSDRADSTATTTETRTSDTDGVRFTDQSADSTATSDDGDPDSTDFTTHTPTDELPEPAAIPAYSGGNCPTMESGRVALNSLDRDREILLELPDEPADAPVLFIYHGNGGNATQMADFFQASRIASEFGVIVVTPESSGSFNIEWPIVGNENKSVDETLFTDVLACLDEEHGIDRWRVYTTGFSAGGLWSTWLALHMTDYLASAAIFAGGVSNFTFGYESPSWQIPVLATHGGPEDVVIINFKDTSEELADALVNDGHLTIMCGHDQGHIIPWNVPDLAMPWLLSHRFGEEDSSFRDGLDSGWPAGCELWE